MRATPEAMKVILVSLLRRRSVKFGDFILSSGKKSDFYVDARQTTLSADGSLLVAGLILDRLRPDVAAVGGLTLGADPIACAVAVLSAVQQIAVRPIHAFLIRKEARGHGTGQKVEGLGNIPPGSRVCIVEDTTTTGHSLLLAVEAAVAAGLDVVQCITVVDRLEGAAEAVAAAGYELEALTTRRDLEEGSLAEVE